MAPRPAPDFEALLAGNAIDKIAANIINYDIYLTDIQRNKLQLDPFDALSEHPNLEIAYEPLPIRNCSVAGYLRLSSSSPVLVIHPSGTFRRDAFTLLHEYGHYLQLVHPEWSDVLQMLQYSYQRSIEERVADEVAAQLLMPDDVLTVDPWNLSAKYLSELFQTTSVASRSALAHRLVAQSPSTKDLMVAVIGNFGNEIVFSRATGELMALGIGVKQPFIADLAEQASESPRRLSVGKSTDKIYARSGKYQTDIRIEVAIEDSGYGFVVVKRANKFGSPAWATTGPFLCSNVACEEIFTPDESNIQCTRCGMRRCPECRECACEPQKGLLCEECYITLTPAEIAGQLEHECF